MSVILEGQMTNKVINGANGDFSVGNLKTDVGLFKVRNEELMKDLDEGEYQVKVVVCDFSINVYSSKRTGIAISEILADITALEVIDENKGPVEHRIVEPDASVEPVKTEAKAKVETPVEPKQKAKDKKPKAPIVLSNKKTAKNKVTLNDRVFDLDNDSEMSEVFGHLWPLDNAVKQDNTVNRVFLEVQRKYFDYKGYVLEFTTQTWHKS